MKKHLLPLRHPIALLTLAAFLALLAGCVSSGRNFDETKVSQIRKGTSTEADLVGLFGPPRDRGVDSQGVVQLTWHYMESRTKGQGFIPIAGPFMGGSDSRHKFLSVTLGPDGKVTGFHASGGGDEIRHTTQETPRN